MKKCMKLSVFCLMVLLLVCACSAALADDCNHTGSKTSYTATSPTCTEPGVLNYKCDSCGKDPCATAPIEKLGHNYSDWQAQTQPTCSSEGKNVKKCSRCGDISETQTVAKLSHVGGGVTNTVSATCEKGGYSYQTCTVCGAQCNVTNQTDAKGHNYPTEPNSVIDATCSDGGRKIFVCKNGCGIDNVVYTTKLQHSYLGTADATLSTAATCGAKGVNRFPCQNKGCTYVDERDVTALAHTFPAKYDVQTAATCKDAGVEVRACSVCGSKETRPIAKVSHSYTGAATVITAATCTASGKSNVACVYGCGTVSTVTVKALGHDYSTSADSNSEPASCTKSGKSYFTCKRTGCSYVKSETVKALGHSYSDTADSSSKLPTCTEAGVTNFTCQRNCGNVKTTTVKALGHKKVETITKQPTCTEKGSKDVTCSTCKATLETGTAIAATGHKGAWVTTVAATKSKPGTATQTCTVCKAVSTKSVPYEEIYYKNTLSTAGVRVRDITQGVTTDWHMVAPIDLTRDGRYDVGIVGTNKFVVGTLSATVKNGSVTFDLKLNYDVVVVSEFLTVFTDVTMISSLESNFNTPFSFGRAYDIAGTFDGAEMIFVYYNAVASYNAVANGVTNFTYDETLINRIR